MLRRTCAVALLYAALAAGGAEARPGDLDQTFGLGGFVSTDFGDNEPATDVAIQPDGKIVAVGGVTGQFSVARYNPDGSLDPSFGGGDGLVTTGFGAPSTATSVAIQPDGKIVVAGNTVAGPSPNNVAVVRYLAGGALDPGFNGGVPLFTDLGADDFASEVLIGPGGEITAVGGTVTAPGASNFAFARYETDGTPDNSFDGDGLRTVNFGALDAAFAAALQPDGMVVAAGFSIAGNHSEIALARLTPSGAPDPGLHGTGQVLTAVGNGAEAESVAVQPDGRIVVAGAADSPTGGDFAMVRYRPDGTLDPSFGDLATVLRDRGTSMDVAMQPNGKIVALSGPSFGVSRFNADGSDDAGFGQNGYAPADFGDNSFAVALALQPDAKIVTAGFTETGPNPENFGLVRMLGGEPETAGPVATCKGRPATIVAVPGARTKGTGSSDVILGTSRRDRIKGGGGSDLICTLAGRSRVDAGRGRDLVVGGNRRDVLRGGGGADTLRGKGANDHLVGGGGADRLIAGKGGRDRCAGGAGRDRTRGCERD